MSIALEPRPIDRRWTPFPLQLAMVDAVEDAVAKGKRATFINAFTGARKTRAAAIVAERRGGPILITAHQNGILETLAEEFATVFEPDDIGVYNGEKKHNDRPIVIASLQILATGKGREWLAERRFRTAIVDESHHGPYLFH